MLVDLSDPGYRDAVVTLLNELKSYLPELVNKNRLIIGTKLDILGTEDNLKELEKMYDNVTGISAVTGNGIEKCRQLFAEMV